MFIFLHLEVLLFLFSFIFPLFFLTSSLLYNKCFTFTSYFFAEKCKMKSWDILMKSLLYFSETEIALSMVTVLFVYSRIFKFLFFIFCKFYTIYFISLLGKYLFKFSMKNFSPSFLYSFLYIYFPFPLPVIKFLSYICIALGKASSFIFV